MTEERLEGEDMSPDSLEAEPASGPGGAEAVKPDDLPAEEVAAPEAEPADEAAPVPLEEIRKAVEALLFSASEPLMVRTLSELLGRTVHEVREAIEDLRLEYIDTGRAFRIEDIAGGVQLLTVKEYDPWIRRLHRKEREGRLSPASMESLSVIAYKQPITRSELEAIRGVTCGPTLKTLLDRGLVKIVGRSEALGRPLLYGTTRRFLESFGISSVRELPQPELETKMQGLPPVEKPTGEAAGLFDEVPTSAEPAAASEQVQGQQPPPEDELDEEDEEEEDDEDEEDEEDEEEEDEGEEDEGEEDEEEEEEEEEPSEDFSPESPPAEKA
jgi:segregation and condensation protein B